MSTKTLFNIPSPLLFTLKDNKIVIKSFNITHNGDISSFFRIQFVETWLKYQRKYQQNLTAQPFGLSQSCNSFEIEVTSEVLSLFDDITKPLAILVHILDVDNKILYGKTVFLKKLVEKRKKLEDMPDNTPNNTELSNLRDTEFEKLCASIKEEATNQAQEEYNKAIEEAILKAKKRINDAREAKIASIRVNTRQEIIDKLRKALETIEKETEDTIASIQKV